MTEENEQKDKAVVFHENNIIGAKIDKLTSMIGKLYTKYRQLKPKRSRV